MVAGDYRGPRGDAAESLALGALDWLLGAARTTGGALTWAGAVPGDRADFTLYHGCAGIVLALACDRHVEQADGQDFAGVLVDDLAGRATVDAGGARWSNHEHRATPSALDPRTGWAMGNAGIIRELLRFARSAAGRDPAYAVPWPDHPPAVPGHELRS
jgi:hypothetical protein